MERDKRDTWIHKIIFLNYQSYVLGINYNTASSGSHDRSHVSETESEVSVKPRETVQPEHHLHGEIHNLHFQHNFFCCKVLVSINCKLDWLKRYVYLQKNDHKEVTVLIQPKISEASSILDCSYCNWSI